MRVFLPVGEWVELFQSAFRRSHLEPLRGGGRLASCTILRTAINGGSNPIPLVIVIA